MNPEPIIQNEVSQKRKTDIIYKYIYLESRKIVLMNLFAGPQWRHRHREEPCGHSEGRRGRDKFRGAWKHIHYHMYNR